MDKTPSRKKRLYPGIRYKIITKKILSNIY